MNTDLNYEYLNYPDQSLKDFYKNDPNNELARWFFLEIDGRSFQTLVSCNYSLSANLLKERFNAKKVNISPASHDLIVFDNEDTKTIIDYNLTLGSKKLAIKSDYEDSYLLIEIDELAKRTNIEILDLEILPIYKAKVSFVSPVSMREDYEKTLHPFFGISLQNSNFVRPKLLASLEWICNRYRRCSVLIGDSIHRITLQTSENLSKKDALDHALFLGKKFLQDELHIFEKFSQRCSFDFIFCSEVQEYPEYKEYYDSLENLFYSNNAFRNSVISFARNYHVKRQDTLSHQDWENLMSSSCQYFLEEFAIFSCLKKRERSVMIYPGSFSTLSEIAAGKYPEALEELKGLTVVSLHIKKR
jgi:tRNA-dependent cyclodipeptide synthase